MAIIKELDNITWEGNFLLVTCDVNSLHTIIPHDLECEAVQYFLKEVGHYEEEVGHYEEDQIKFVIEGIRLLLDNNYFWYDRQFYLQLTGTAMGKIYE